MKINIKKFGISGIIAIFVLLARHFYYEGISLTLLAITIKPSPGFPPLPSCIVRIASQQLGWVILFQSNNKIL